MSSINIQVEQQQNYVADEVSALVAVVRPILQGLLFAIKQDVAKEAGGIENLKLFMLPRVYRPGAGDCGICFEYAVHDAILRKDPMVVERVHDSLTRHCRVPGIDTASILFGAEKTGALQIIGNAGHLLTEESRVLTGAQAQPPKLKQYIKDLTQAFHRQTYRDQLPSSISGLWKADLFLGNRDTDRWVGTTVKINRSHLEGAPGLRIGIVPSQYGRGDQIVYDCNKNLVICPLPYDGAFMEIFYSAWWIVKCFIDADAKMPRPESLPVGSHRMVAQLLEQRRDFPVLDVVSSLVSMAQSGLLSTTPLQVPTNIGLYTPLNVVNSLIAPQPLIYK